MGASGLGRRVEWTEESGGSDGDLDGGKWASEDLTW